MRCDFESIALAALILHTIGVLMPGLTLGVYLVRFRRTRHLIPLRRALLSGDEQGSKFRRELAVALALGVAGFFLIKLVLHQADVLGPAICGWFLG